jgi:hypothetical protein
MTGEDAGPLLQGKAADACAIHKGLDVGNTEASCRKGSRCRSLGSPRPQFQ